MYSLNFNLFIILIVTNHTSNCGETSKPKLQKRRRTKTKTKSHIQETQILLTNADRSTDIKKRKRKKNLGDGGVQTHT